MRRQPPSSSLFPSTTLFRSPGSGQVAPAHLAPARPAPGDLVPGPLASARPAPAHLAPALVGARKLPDIGSFRAPTGWGRRKLIGRGGQPGLPSGPQPWRTHGGGPAR